MSGGHGGGHGRRPKKHEEEEHENHERWLVSYADMLTLLFVLFVVLFAISAVDQKKFDALKEGLASGFGAPITAMDGGTGPLDNKGTQPQVVDRDSIITPSNAGDVGPGTPMSAAEEAAVTAAEKRLLQQDLAARMAKAKRIKQLQEKLDAAISQRGLQRSVTTRVNDQGVVVSIISSDVVFAPSNAQLRVGGERILDTVGPILKSVNNDLLVVGNTDTSKQGPTGFENEWYLSGARAAAVITYLSGPQHIAQSRFMLGANAMNDPLYNPSTAGADARNRRVDITVLADPIKRGAASYHSSTSTGSDSGASALTGNGTTVHVPNPSLATGS